MKIPENTIVFHYRGKVMRGHPGSRVNAYSKTANGIEYWKTKKECIAEAKSKGCTAEFIK